MAELGAGRDPMRTRRRVLATALVAALTGAGVALGVASQVESPQEAAANARTPSPSVITGTVGRTVLAETVTVQGTVTAGQTLSVTGAETAPAGDDPVVTMMPLHVGEEVYPGQLLAEVSGRPLIVLPGKLPAYRALLPGDTGPDVLQLQQALIGLSYDIADTPGTFSDSTEAALVALYTRLGYSPPTTQAGAMPTPRQGTGSAAPQQGAGSQHGTGAKSPVVYLPKGEVRYLPSLPARVASIPVGVGSAAAGAVLTLATGELKVTCALDPVNGPLVKAGMRASVWLQADSTQRPLRAKVAWVGQLAVNSGTGASYPATLSGLSSLPVSWAGQSVTISIEVSTTNDPVLVVPIAAVYSAADGTTHVVAYHSGHETVIPVHVGASVGGLVQVSALSGGLVAGEDVIVGVAGQ